jgi:hypothetical protein
VGQSLLDIELLTHCGELLSEDLLLVLIVNLHTLDINLARYFYGMLTDFTEPLTLFDVHSELGLQLLNLR